MKKLGLRAGIIAAVIIGSILLIFRWSAEKRAQGRLNINLGLDLQGGSHLVLEVVTTDALDNECDTVAGRISQQFKDKGITGATVVREGHDTVTLSAIPAEKSGDADLVVAEAAAGW